MPPTKQLLTIALVGSFIIGGAAGAATGLLATNTVTIAGKTFGPLFKIQSPAAASSATVPDKTTIPSVQIAPAKSEEDSVTEAVKRVSPSVVSIVISKDLATVNPQSTGPIFPDDFFGFVIPQTPTPIPLQPGMKRQVGGGTGFIITADGLILTNKHVVSDTTATYSVVMSNGKTYDAIVLARDAFADVAFIKINATGLPIIRLGNSDAAKIGSTVIAIGNTLSEYQNTVTKGVISGINRRVEAGGGAAGSEVIEGAIQTDAAINPGNSGGPLINLAGEVVGINTAVSLQGQLIGFAIPINVVKPVIDSIKTTGRIVRPWLGIRYVIINKDMQTKDTLPTDYGALISRGNTKTAVAVIPESPAEKAGLKEHDIILEIDKQKITEATPLSAMVQRHKPGDKITLKVLSDGKEKTVTVTLEELPRDPQ